MYVSAEILTLNCPNGFSLEAILGDLVGVLDMARNELWDTCACSCRQKNSAASSSGRINLISLSYYSM